MLESNEMEQIRGAAVQFWALQDLALLSTKLFSCLLTKQHRWRSVDNIVDTYISKLHILIYLSTESTEY
jgi:hypothetical protein